MDAGKVEERVETVGIAFDGLCRLIAALLARDVQLDADDTVRAAGLKVRQGLAVVSRENGPLSGLVQSFDDGTGNAARAASHKCVFHS